MKFMNVNGLTPLALGAEGERFARQQFEAMGYVVRPPLEKKTGDLAVIDKSTGEVIKVEVKTSRNGSDGRWQFCVTRRAVGRNKTDCQHADVVLLQAVNAKTGLVTAYIVPAKEMNGQAILRISSAGSALSKWARFMSDYQIMEVNHEWQKVA